MRDLVAILLCVLQLCLAASAEHTLESVEAQINSYLGENHGVTTRSSPLCGCDIACGFLAFLRPGLLFYPNTSSYNLQEQYWSQQQALTLPTCRFTPAWTPDVSLAVLTLRITSCHFAVKSGGHAAFAGASNIEGGLTIDLSGLNRIAVSRDQSVTSVGAGNLWHDVYAHLDPKNLTVIGGRVAAIGVGGLTLGGGMSFFSSRYGWACDNVNTYEVVLADGSIRRVSYDSVYSDLYWALRGGGNNFGIVTSFDLATYPQGDLWAGSRAYIYEAETAAAINNAFYYLGINAPKDPYAQVIIAYAYAQSVGLWIIASDLQYGKPEPKPPILRNFTAIAGAVSDTLRITNLTGLTVEFNNSNPGGYRQTYWTLTVGNSADLMAEMVAIFMDEVEPLKDAVGIVPSIIFQPITTDMTTHFSKAGGNPLGLAGQGPLNLINVDFSWSDPADDARILAAAQNVINRSAAAAKACGLSNPYLYQNYAALQQDVFAGYGAANLARLKAIHTKYDPQNVWQKLQPGYFKLG